MQALAVASNVDHDRHGFVVVVENVHDYADSAVDGHVAKGNYAERRSREGVVA